MSGVKVEEDLSTDSQLWNKFLISFIKQIDLRKEIFSTMRKQLDSNSVDFLLNGFNNIMTAIVYILFVSFNPFQNTFHWIHKGKQLFQRSYIRLAGDMRLLLML